MEGYVKAPHSIVRDPSLSATAKVAWLLIAGMPDGYHPTREQWMAMLGVKDKTTWWKTIKELEDASLIEITTSGKRRFFKALYMVEKNHHTMVEKTHHKRVEKPTIEGWKNPPLKKNIEEQEKNIPEVRARLREEVMQDMMVEMGCRSVGISLADYHSMADEIFNDWTFQDLPDHEWSKSHFLAVLRIKAKEQIKQNSNGQRIINADPVARRQAERQQRVAEIAAATAAFTAKGKRPTKDVF